MARRCRRCGLRTPNHTLGCPGFTWPQLAVVLAPFVGLLGGMSWLAIR